MNRSGVKQRIDSKLLKHWPKANRLYEDKFGYIFIVCATGKSAEEMLGLLQARLPNAPEEEIKIAADEQNKITKSDWKNVED